MEESLVSCFSICAVCVKTRRETNGINIKVQANIMSRKLTVKGKCSADPGPSYHSLSGRCTT